MSNWKHSVSVLSLAVFLLSGIAAAAKAPDTILYGGTVFTSVEGDLWAEAVAIAGRHIVAVGSDDEVLALAGPHTELIDLESRLVIPGLNDAHTHVLPFNTIGPIINDPSFIPGPGPDIGELSGVIQAAVAQYPAGTWLFGIVGEAIVDDPSVDRFLLDPLAPLHPVMLLGWGGHKVYLNTAAMNAAGIADDEADPFGGYYERVPGTDTLSGVLIEYAHYRLYGFLASVLSIEDVRARLGVAYQLSIERGITSIQQMNMLPLGVQEEILDGMDLPLRVRTICVPLSFEESRQDCTPGRGMRNPRGLARSSGVKWITDGTPIESHMALSEPYADQPDWWGTFNFPLDVFQEQVSDALRGPRSRAQRLIHAVGDRPVDHLLAAMSAAGPDGRWRSRRLRLEHGDMIRPDHYQGLADKGVVVVQNPTHFTIPGLFLKRIGPERMAHLEPLRSLLDSGIVLALGSDAIGGVGNPFVDIMLAVLHPAHPAEGITLEEAVIAYTWGSAYAEFMEHRKGTLRPGKLADLAVLSQNIFTVPPTALPETFSLLTMVDGRIVHDAEVLERD